MEAILCSQHLHTCHDPRPNSGRQFNAAVAVGAFFLAVGLLGFVPGITRTMTRSPSPASGSPSP
jgi:hypothetical protein